MDKISVQGTSVPNKVTLRYYKDFFVSSLWIVGAFVIAGVIVAYLISRLVTPAYQVTTTIMVSKESLGQSANYDTVLAGQNLSRTYAQMVTSVGVLDQVRQQLGKEMSLGELKGMINVTPLANTPLIDITVEHSNPELAMKIVNSLIEALSSQIKQIQTETASYQDAMLDNQLQQTENEIAQLQNKIEQQSLQLYDQRLNTTNKAIDSLREQITHFNEEIVPLTRKPELTSAEQIQLSELQSRKDELSALLKQYQNELVLLTVRGATYDSQDLVSSQDAALLDQYQRTYLNLLNNYSDLKVSRLQNSVSVVQVDRPVFPKNPTRPNLTVNLVLGFVVGLLLSGIYIFVMKLR